MPKYNDNGEEIVYTVTEEGNNKFYTIESTTGNMQEGYTITNKFQRPEETTEITVNKIWKDNNEQANRRPGSIIIVVKNGDQEVASKKVTSNDIVEGTINQWTVTIDKLQKYDDNGNEIKYTIDEKEDLEDTVGMKFYEKTGVTEVKDGQASITNSYKTPSDKVSVKVTKAWEDTEDQEDKRPKKVTIVLKADTEEVAEQRKEITTEENKEVTFDNLPKYDSNGKEIVYTVTEEGNNKFYKVEEVAGNMQEGYTITNKFIRPTETVDLTVNKVWVDNETQAKRRPESIVVNLKAENADGKTAEDIIDTATLDTATQNSYTFTNLAKYNNNGDEIIYKVEETEANEGDLHFYQKTEGKVINVEGEENKKQVTITNTFTRPEDKTEVIATKIWEDNNNEAQKRPESIKLALKNGNEQIGEDVTITQKDNGIVNVENPVKETSNTWKYTFTGVEKYNENGQEIQYTVDEKEVNNNDLQFYTKNVNGMTITNTFTPNTDKVEVTVRKIWEEENNIQAQRRPEKVRIILKANGKEEKRIELTGEGNEWTYTFKDLAKYDQYNNIINYTVDEEEINKDDLKFYSKSITGTTITNTFTRPEDKIEIKVNKNWEDNQDMYKKRPVSIKLQVKTSEGITGQETDKVIKEQIVTKEDNWSYTFKNLDKYDANGEEIEYKIDEEEVIEKDLFHYTKEIGELEKTSKEGNKEGTITNKMTKIPGKVVVKYVDKASKEEISDRVEKEGIIGEEYDVTEDKKEIPGYTLIEEPEEPTGTYKEEKQEKVYYYAKNTKVIVKYLEKGTNKILTEEPQYEIEGYEGKGYTTERKQIEGYTYVEDTRNTSGTMKREEIEVIYYYEQNTKVTVKYLEKDNTPNDNSDNKVLKEEETINGYVGKEYKTEEKEIQGYTFVESTENTEGKMTKEPIEVIYYYAQNTKVIVKYLEKDNTPEDNTDNKVLKEEEIIKGYEGKEYKTEQKTINNYEFVESTENTEGKMTKEPLEVIYYYIQKTKAKVQHIDRETGEILKEETKEGKVGDIFETHAEDFEGYVLVESPKEPDIIMDKTGNQIVKYYYAHVSAGVIEKHIDEITGELLYSEEHKGNEGDYYNILSKTFEGYDLLEKDKEGNNRLPENAEGEMKKELIEVKYYYIKRARVIVEHVDITPGKEGEKLAEDETIEGHEKDEYETKEKEIKGYNCVDKTDNWKGTMEITKNEDGSYNIETKVTYYYKKQAGGVKEKHIDIATNKILAEEEHKGNVGDSYDIPAREFDNYELVEDKLPTNSKGEMTEKEIEVIYYYKQQAKVRVEYIDKRTGEKLTEDEIIKGYVGDKYETEEKQFDGYELVEKPSNGKGEMKKEEIVVKYYYERKAEVEIKYIEKETGYEIKEKEKIEGYVGDEYETEEKEIEYYKLIEKTTNYKGKMEEEKITVIYYYEKLIFNLGVDKWIGNVKIDGISGPGQSINNKDELYKADIHRSKTTTTEIEVTYKIRITNTGEIEGQVGKITEIIPSGFEYRQEDNKMYWEETNGILTTDDLKEETIKPGESKEIEIKLRWMKGEENFGQKTNIVMISELSNPAGYTDINKEDNSSRSDMLLTIATGLDRNDRIIIIGVVQIVLAISIGLLLSYKKKVKK